MEKSLANYFSIGERAARRAGEFLGERKWVNNFEKGRL